MSKNPRSRLAEWLRFGAAPFPEAPGEPEAVVAAMRAERVAGLLYASMDAGRLACPQRLGADDNRHEGPGARSCRTATQGCTL
jgi:hypothetical protein